jgi:hypothetical protein
MSTRCGVVGHTVANGFIEDSYDVTIWTNTAS